MQKQSFTQIIFKYKGEVVAPDLPRFYSRNIKVSYSIKWLQLKNPVFDLWTYHLKLLADRIAYWPELNLKCKFKLIYNICIE